MHLMEFKVIRPKTTAFYYQKRTDSSGFDTWAHCKNIGTIKYTEIQSDLCKWTSLLSSQLSALSKNHMGMSTPQTA